MGDRVTPDTLFPATPERETAPATVSVCTACRAADGETRPGLAFAEALAGHLAGRSGLSIAPADCLAVCQRAVTLALSGPGRWTYVIGDLADPAEAAAIACAYQASDTGIVPWRERPPGFRKGVIARVPPLSKDSAP